MSIVTKQDKILRYCCSQENLQPTDVLMNFGVWLMETDATCGDKEGEECTNIPALCKYLKGDHLFTAWWVSSSPMVDGQKVADSIPPGHHLDLPTRCQLDEKNVLNRTAVLHALEPDAELQHKLFWNRAHMHAEVNHGFNRQFLGRLAKPERATTTSQQRWRHTHLWKQMFGS